MILSTRGFRRWSLAGFFVLGGCFYPADRGRLLEARVERLNDENQRLTAQLKDSQDKLAATLKQVEVALEGLDKASRRTDADIGVQLQKTVEDVAMLRGQIETYQYRVAELEAALKRTHDDLDKRAVEKEGADAVKAAEAKKRAEELKRPEQPKEFLALADDKVKGGDVAMGRALYAEFLKKWPKDDGAGDAHFRLGETYFNEEKCREALFEYGKVIQDFTKSKAAPHAYLRSSECFKKLKMQDETRLALEELLKQHPRSDAAKVAKQRLAELDKEKGPKKAPKK